MVSPTLAIKRSTGLLLFWMCLDSGLWITTSEAGWWIASAKTWLSDLFPSFCSWWWWSFWLPWWWWWWSVLASSSWWWGTRLWISVSEYARKDNNMIVLLYTACWRKGSLKPSKFNGPFFYLKNSWKTQSWLNPGGWVEVKSAVMAELHKCPWPLYI